MAETLDLSVIIVNWNVKDLLRECLKSLYAATRGIAFEVFVVDNASTDGSSQMVQGEFPQVHLIENTANLGFARANNQAIRLSQGRHVLLLNPDTVVLPDALTRMVRFADSHLQIGAIGPRILRPNGAVDFRCARRFPSLTSELWEKTGLATRFPNSRIFGEHLMGHWDHKDGRPVDLLTGACLMARREVIDRVGLMDEDFFLYGEDVDWCYRIKRAGWQVFYYADVGIIHFGGQSSASVQLELDMEALRSLNLFFRKNYGALYALAHRLLMLALTLTKGGYFLGKLLAIRDAEKRAIYQHKLKLHQRVLQWVFSGHWAPM